MCRTRGPMYALPGQVRRAYGIKSESTEIGDEAIEYTLNPTDVLADIGFDPGIGIQTDTAFQYKMDL